MLETVTWVVLWVYFTIGVCFAYAVRESILEFSEKTGAQLFWFWFGIFCVVVAWPLTVERDK